MKVIYNQGGDKLNILFRSAPISETETHRPGLILDYDQQGHLIGLEIANASRHMPHPHMLDFVELVEAAPNDEPGQNRYAPAAGEMRDMAGKLNEAARGSD